jgi:hypothetical protein
MITLSRRAICYGHIIGEKGLLFARFVKLSDDPSAARERIAALRLGNQLFTPKGTQPPKFLTLISLVHGLEVCRLLNFGDQSVQAFIRLVCTATSVFCGHERLRQNSGAPVLAMSREVRSTENE